MDVYFSGNFWGHHNEKEQALQEIRIGREFVWEDVRGFIPAMYTGADGLVVDLCIRIERQRIEAFLEKWLERAENGRLTPEEHEELQRDDPCKEQFSLEITINGESLLHAYGCGCCFNPVMIEKQERMAAEERARFAAEHAQAYEAGAEPPIEENEQGGCSIEEQLADAYGCDKTQGWYFKRCAFHWSGTQTEDIRSVKLTFHAEKTSISVEPFETGADCEGQQVELQDPFTEERVVLTIHECEAAQLPEETFRNMRGMEYPTHYRTISYTTEPELARDALLVQDRSRGDAPRGDMSRSKAAGAIAVIAGSQKADDPNTTIIGSADGPTSIFIAGRSPVKERRVAMSALHFEAVDRVSWKPTFRRAERSDMTMELM